MNFKIWKGVLTSAVLGAFVALSSPASALSLGLVGGTTIADLPNNFGVLRDVNGNVDRNNFQFGNLPTNGTDPFTITRFTSAKNAGDGLTLDGDATVEFIYLGTEAGFTNTATSSAFGGLSFNNKTSIFGDIISGDFSPASPFSLLDFAFETNGNGGKVASNVGAISTGLTLAFGEIFNNGLSVLAFFGDNGGDSDLDDIVVRINVIDGPGNTVGQVPLPTALPLFGTGLAVMGFVGWRRKRKAGVSV